MFNFSPEIIKAAASSPRGILSLMCLLIGAVALAFFKDAPVFARLFVFTISLLGVAGFAHTVIQQKESTAEIRPGEAKPFSFPGRWQIQVNIVGVEAASFIDYFPDGTFDGSEEHFVGGQGQKTRVSGKWILSSLTHEEFRLQLNYDNGNSWQGRFRIFDPNRIHNTTQNCVVVRVPV